MPKKWNESIKKLFGFKPDGGKRLADCYEAVEGETIPEGIQSRISNQGTRNPVNQPGIHTMEHVKAILELNPTGEPMTASEIEMTIFRNTGVEMNPGTLRNYLSRLVRKGQVSRPERGKYQIRAKDLRI